MESEYSHNEAIVNSLLNRINKSLDLISEWNKNIQSPDSYLTTPEGTQIIAATCMLLESIGEAFKKIDKLMPDYLQNTVPNVPWKQIKGLRDHIAHGYFDIDADVIFDVVYNEIDTLKQAVTLLQNRLK